MFDLGLSKANGLVLGPKKTEFFDTQWWRNVWVGTQQYRVGVSRGDPHRRMYAKAGSPPGFWWNGWVAKLDESDRLQNIWSGKVGKTLGARGLLENAGVLP